MGRLQRLTLILWQTWRSMKRILAVKDFDSPAGRAEVRRLSQEWALYVLGIVGAKVTVSGEKLAEGPCLFVSNHMGFLDIPLLMSLIDASWVAKSEVRNWPIFGNAAAAVETVFVKRASDASKKHTADEVGSFIAQRKKSVVLCPEGTSSSHGKQWKRGSFVIAHQFGFPVQPVRICFRPLRDCCYINDDNFATSLWRLLRHTQVEASVEYFKPRKIVDVEADTQAIETMVQNSVRQQLMAWGEPLEPLS